MLQLENRTPFEANLAVFAAPDGVETAYGAIKATFHLRHGAPVLAPRQAILLPADVFWGDPAATSLRAAGDVGLCKPATDVLVTGPALATRPTTSMDVAIRVGPLERRLRIFGDRRWVRGKENWNCTDPEPFASMPLRWELAFGGTSPQRAGSVPQRDPRNPVGKGFLTEEGGDPQGLPLPNIENPADLLREPYGRPVPVCSAPIAPSWLPRRGFAGTYDDAWRATRAPFLPLDFDARYFNVAAPDFVAPAYLEGGEDVRIEGCTEGGAWVFQLPRPQIRVQWEFDGRTIDALPRLETVLVEPDLARLQLLWRAALPLGKKTLRLKRLAVEAADFAHGAGDSQ